MKNATHFKFSFILIAAVLALPQAAQEAAESGGKTLPKKADEERIKTLVAELGSQEFEARESAQATLLSMDCGALAILKRCFELQTDPEILQRLKAVLWTLSHPRWLGSVEEAKGAALKTGKPIMVFSTIGPSNGFS